MTVLFLALTSPAFALAGQPGAEQQLRCLDDGLEPGDLAAAADTLGERTEEDAPAGAQSPARGAPGAFSRVLGGCASLHRWSGPQREAATRYLIAQGRISRIALREGPEWAAAMERYAPFGARLLPGEGEPGDHARAMLAAGARSNGVAVPDGGDVGSVLEYIAAQKGLEEAVRAFAAVS